MHPEFSAPTTKEIYMKSISVYPGILHAEVSNRCDDNTAVLYCITFLDIECEKGFFVFNIIPSVATFFL